ncbi:MAG TPA: response regulator [Candidatus Binatia bacterium]|nr:response regulator [Candidatus Binatia bacterium]
MTESVLIVDDHVNARIIAQALLESRGMKVCTAIDGHDACEVLQRADTTIAVVVMSLDLSTQGLNGWELLRRLRGRLEGPPLRTHPRIVVVTSRSEPETERFARRLGADAFLRAPYPPRDFVLTVEQLVAADSLDHAQSGALHR